MFTHVVVYSLVETADAAEVVRRLKEMRTLAPLVTSVDAGVDVSRTPASYDVALVTTHPDAEAYQGYLSHPVHQELFAWLKPQLAGRTLVDFTD